MRVKFTLKDDKQDSLAVVEARAHEGINTVPTVELLLSSKAKAEASHYLGKTADFKAVDATTDEVKAAWRGVVVGFSDTDAMWSAKNAYAYKAVMRPSLWKLAFNHKSRAFLNQTRPDAVQKALKGAGVSGFKMESLNNSGAHPELEQIVQYRETDLDFVLRTMCLEGLNFYFLPVGFDLKYDSVTDPADYFRITDDQPSLSEQKHPIDITYRARSGLIAGEAHADYLGWQAMAAPQYVSVQSHKSSDSYQAYAPTNQKRQVTGGVWGQVYFFEDTAAASAQNSNWTPQDFADKTTKIRAEELEDYSGRGQGASNELRVRPPLLVTFSPDPLAAGNGSEKAQYLITKVDHQWSQGRDAKGDAQYQNTFEMVAKGVHLHPPFITPWPPK